MAPAIAFSSALASDSRPGVHGEDHSRIDQMLGGLPLSFIENRGQLDPRVAYYLRGKDKALYFTATGVTFVLSETARRASSDGPSRISAGRHRIGGPALSANPRRWTLRLEFVGGDPAAAPHGEDRAPAVVNYFTGPQSKWKVGLKTYSKVVYANLWPGIDLVYSGSASRLKYEFLVRPGADPSRIRLAYRGARSVSVNEREELEVVTPLAGFHDDRPTAYQEVDGRRFAVPVAYVLGDGDGQTAPYGFQLGSYDASRPLVVDPAILVYAGYIGGGGIDRAHGIAVDGDGNVYVTGETLSDQVSFPTDVGPDAGFNGDTDAFVAKVSPDGSGLVYAGYIGGAGEDRGFAIAVDSDGSAYVTGETTSNQTTFPVTIGPDLTHNGGVDAFVAKIGADGMGLAYAGYIGGFFDDRGFGIAVDGGGNAYIAGETASNQFTFPVGTGPDLTHNGNVDAFVAKVGASGAGLIYTGYIGGAGEDRGKAIALPAGCPSGCEAYITGETLSDQFTFPVATGPDLTHNGSADAFVAKVAASGASLVYAGYIGGFRDDRGNGIAVDSFGNAYVAGETLSDQFTFPVATGPDLGYNGDVDAFVAKVRANGTGLTYAGYIGGSALDRAGGIAVDAAGIAYVTGETTSNQATFPVSQGPDLTHNGGPDAFVAKVRSDGGALLSAGYVGGSGDDSGHAIAVDEFGSAFIAGETVSSQFSFPQKNGPDLTHNGATDAFVAKICTADCVNLNVKKTASPKIVEAGGELTYTVTVKNKGPDGASGVIVVDSLPPSATLLMATPSSGSCGGMTTVTCDLGDLPLGGSATVTLVVTTTMVESIVNVASVSANETETNFADNEATVKSKVTLPDLVVQRISTSKFVAPGDSLVITDRTANRQAVPAGGSTTRFYLSADKTLDGTDALLGARAVPPLGPKEKNEGATAVTINASTAPGKYFIIGVADADAEVTELNEAKNQKAKRITVTLADLVVKGLSGFSSGAAGATITISDAVKNRGKVPADASTTRFFISSDDVLDGGDVLLGSRAIPALAGKETSAGETMTMIPPGTVPGSYFVIAAADADDAVVEIDEGNNHRARALLVTP